MLFSLISLALLSGATSVAALNQRQVTDAAQFTSVADELISQYIPSTAFPLLESAIAPAASIASVQGSDAKSLIYSAIKATSVPDWFASAIPTEWAAEVSALEAEVSALQPTPPTETVVPVVTVYTSTDSAGSMFTSTITSTPALISATITPLASAGSIYSSLTTEVISGVTSVFTVAVSHATGVASTIVSGGSSVVSVVSSGGSSVVSRISSVGSSIAGEITGSTSRASGAVPTAVSGAAAGVVGLVGLMIAL